MVEAASAPGAGYDEQEALKKQTIGGVGMAVLLGGIGLAYILPKPYGLITLAAGIGGCWLCVFVIRRTQQPPA
ncbi:hypothetical protein [Aeromicrobium sp.]|uniref:hypothetical protein n=1 Tax=Aeromicrobium sp. TaxID=1871063 RepID=UPI002FCCAB80